MKLASVTKYAPLFAACLSLAVSACKRTNPLAKFPDTAFSLTPAALSNSSSATFGFFCDDTAGCTYYCAIDNAAESGCASPLVLSSLADGAHTFSVRAKSAAGVFDQSPATYAWTIDTTAPLVVFDGGPAARTNATTATIVFAANDVGAAFSCALDDGGAASCASPQTVDSLSDGTHRFAVRATDDAGNVGDASVYVWIVDTVAPTVVFDGGPASLVSSSSATFVFACTEATCSYTCALDDAGFAPCVSPFAVAGIAEGGHTVSVRATDDAGNAGDASVYAWTADFVPPQSTIQSAVSLVPYGTPNIPLAGTAADGLSGVARVDVTVGDDAGWVQASGTTNWSASFTATRFFHNVRSRATDVAGNVESGDASVTVHTSLMPASAVVGQETFTDLCYGLRSAIGLSSPVAVLFEPGANRLFVADISNGRVVAHQLSASNGFVDFAADLVLGRATLTDCSTPAISASSMNSPLALAFDRARNRLFVSDGNNNRVLVFDTAALTSGQSAQNVLGQDTFAGGGDGTSANRFISPSGLALDPVNDNLFIADTANHRVVVYITSIIVDGEPAAYVLGQPWLDAGASGRAIDRMWSPNDVAYDIVGRRLFVADSNNHRVLMFNFDAGIVDGMAAANVLGQPWFDAGNSGVSATAMNFPRGLAYDDSTRLLYVSDGSNNRVLVFDSTILTNGEAAIAVLGQSVFDAGGSGTSQTSLSSPQRLSLDIDGGRLFVADTSNNRVMVFDISTVTTGEPAVHALGHAEVADAASPIFDSACLNGPGRGRVQFYGTSGIAVDRAGGRLFVASDNDNRVLVFPLDDAGLPQATASTVVGQPDFSHCASRTGPTGLYGPGGVAFDSMSQRIYVADRWNNRVLVYSTTALVSGAAATAVLGQGDFDASGAGTSATTFSSPNSIDVDTARARLFVGDTGNYRVMVFNIDGGVTNGMAASYYLGAGSSFSNAQAATSQNGLRSASGIAVDVASGRLFVADKDSHRVVVFETTVLWNGKAASTVLGQNSFATNGTSSSSTGMYYPSGVAFDAVYSRLFVADSSNNRVLLFDTKQLATGMSATNVIGQLDWGPNAFGASATALYLPRSVATDGTGRWLYVTDTSNSRVLAFDVGPSY